MVKRYQETAAREQVSIVVKAAAAVNWQCLYESLGLGTRWDMEV